MDIQRAKELLAVLSDGVNPLTGEVLPEDDSCNQVEIVRALNTVLRYLDNQPQKSAKPSPDNAGKPWTAVYPSQGARQQGAVVRPGVQV